jgi:TRAP-type mannitol/chloroaromatic compound transport system permease small subunit
MKEWIYFSMLCFPANQFDWEFSMSALNSIAKGIDSINEWVGRLAAWSVLAAVLVTFIVVVFRYGFEQLYSIALQESAMYFHALIFMLGAAYTLKHDGHVRVDIFYQQFSSRGKALVNLFGSLVLLVPVCVFILWVSADYVMSSWRDLEGSREAGGLPLVFILKSFIPLLAALLLLQAVAEIIHSVTALNAKEANEC